MEKAAEKKLTKKEQSDKLAHAALEEAAKRAGPLGPYIKKAEPAILVVKGLVEKSIPYAHKAYVMGQTGWEKLQPYHPESLVPAFLGLILVFFGGHYLTTIAAVEAFRITGYSTTVASLKVLRANLDKALEASAKDDEVDDDGDGIADVQQIDQQELMLRKAKIVFKSVDPEKVSEALAGISAGAFGVLAALQIQFARAVTLGSSIGDIVYETIDKFGREPIEMAIPEEYRKWVGPTLRYVSKLFGISVAWFVQRVISAFHSALRGAGMCVDNVISYLSKYQGKPRIAEKGSGLQTGLTYGLAFMGFYWQISSGFSLPFPWNLVCLPFTIVEWLLVWVVNMTM